MRVRRDPRGRPARAVLLATLLATVIGLATAGCAGPPPAAATQERLTGRTASPGASPSPSPAVADLERRVRPDLIVRSAEPLPAVAVRKLRDVAGVRESALFGIGSTTVEEEALTVAAVDPSTYRAFAPEGTAESDPLWQRVAGGEAAVAHPVAERLRLRLGASVPVGEGRRLRLGAFATTVPGMDVVVERTAGERLGVPLDNTMVLHVDRDADVSEVADAVRKAARDAVDGRVRVEGLGDAPSGAGKATGQRRAFLTGDDAARAFGSFDYRWLPDGRLWIDPAFVRRNIRTERVPILGEVTCHRLMFPQLRGALQEVVDKGLASAIHPDEYGGCFVPKGIEGSPGAVSLHTWGIAMDLNVPGNLRGTEGEIDRRVVAIFKRWGFAWGGDWSWTDPMHFEMAGLLTGSARR